MTFIDWVLSLPTWAEYIIIGLLVVWVFEMFLYPFKQNIQRERIKHLLDIQHRLTTDLEKRTTELEETNKMLANVMALLLRKEQREEEQKMMEMAHNGRKQHKKDDDVNRGKPGV